MEEQNREPEDYKPLTDMVLIKVMSILFVLAVYGVIFMKILFLE